MRIIKFRAWHSPTGKMYEVGRMFFGNINGASTHLRGYAYSEPNETTFITFNHLMQFTGLLDKNGEEIYEGDIVRVWRFRDDDEPALNEFSDHRVEWCGNGYPAFDLKPNYTEESNGLSHIVAGADGEWMEVIGNIFEPELLQKTGDLK